MIQHQSYFVQFLILLAVVTFAFIAAQFISAIIFFIGGGSLGDLMSDADMENINLMKGMQIVAQLIIFIVPAAIFSYLKTKGWFKYSNFKLPVSAKGLLLTIVALIVSFPIIAQLNIWNQSIALPEFLSGLESLLKSLEEQAKEMTEAFLKMDSIFDLLINLFMVGFLAGLGEELLFRGTIQKFLSEWWNNPHVAIILTGFVFSAIHMQFYGFFPRWALGILFGYIFLWTGNIWIPIIAHALFNGLQVLGYYFVGGDSSFMSDMESIESITNEQKMVLGVTALVSTVVLSFVLRAFYKHSKQQNSMMAYGEQLDQNI